MLAIMHTLDGALATVAPGATAFPWRGQSALVQWYIEPAGPASAAVSWLNAAVTVHMRQRGSDALPPPTAQRIASPLA
jgi:hypothetical protein